MCGRSHWKLTPVLHSALLRSFYRPEIANWAHFTLYFCETGMEKSSNQGYSCRLLVPEYDVGHVNNSYFSMRKEITRVSDKVSLDNRWKEFLNTDS